MLKVGERGQIRERDRIVMIGNTDDDDDDGSEVVNKTNLKFSVAYKPFVPELVKLFLFLFLYFENMQKTKLSEM